MAVEWITPAGSLGILTERVPIDISLSAISNQPSISYSVIAGRLPRGLRLENNRIKGSPTEVNTFTESRFVIRADDGLDIDDRTFKLSIDGSDEPRWITREGFLNVGQGNAYFVLDNSFVDFQLQAEDPDVLVGDVLEYYLSPMGGELPPGLTLTRDGRITGFTDPIFSVDYGTTVSGERLLETELRVGTADNDINAIKSNGSIPEGYSVNHFLTDPNAWFLTTDVPNGMKHFVRTPLSTSMDGDFDTGNARYKARERYSFGVSDPLGIYGSSGSN